MPNPPAFAASSHRAASAPPAFWRRATQALIRLDRHLIGLGDPAAVHEAAEKPARRPAAPATLPHGNAELSVTVSPLLL